MNMNYVYWDIDTTNWNNIYLKYKPLFSSLNLNKTEDLKKSVAYFKQMSSGLIDSHYYIEFLRNGITDSFAYPAFENKKRKLDFHAPYSYWHVDTNYLDTNFKLGFDNTNSFNGQPLTVLYGTLNKKILYFSCNSFNLSKSYGSTSTNAIQPILNSFFNTLDSLPINIKGLIIDVRSNYGGDLSDLNFLVGRLINRPLFFGYTQYKSGNGRLDFTPWVKAFVNPNGKAKELKIPIVLLGDNVSASLSEAIIMAIKTLPNSTFVGERTFGATGPIVESNIYNDGSFIVSDFLKVQTASAKFRYVDGEIYEGKGFPPDILIPFNLNALQKKKDLQLEKAISIIY